MISDGAVTNDEGIISYSSILCKCKATWWIRKDLPEPEHPVTTAMLDEQILDITCSVALVTQNFLSSSCHCFILSSCCAKIKITFFYLSKMPEFSKIYMHSTRVSVMI